MRSHSSRARASTSASGTSTVASSTTASSDGLAELGLGALLVGLAQLRGDVLAQLVERVEAGGVGGEVVVELGQLLALDLLDGHRELRRPGPRARSAP